MTASQPTHSVLGLARPVEMSTKGLMPAYVGRVRRMRTCWSGRRAESLVRIRVPGRVEYGRVEEALMRPWLEARGLLATSR